MLNVDLRAYRSRRRVFIALLAVAVLALLSQLGTTAPARAVPPAAAIRVQTSCPPTVACFTTTRPPVTVSPCINLGNTRICPTTAPAPTTKAPPGGTTVTVPGGAVIVLGGGTPITLPPAVTSPPTPDEARIQVTGFDFGAVQVGLKSAVADVVVSNVGSIPVRYLGTTTEGPFAVVGSTCANTGVLNVRAACTVSVQYGATEAGPQSGNVTVTVLAPAGNLVQAGPLQGTGTRSQISIEPAGVDFGSVTLLDDISPSAMVVRNSGSGPARITAVGFSSVTKDFTIQSSSCVGATLAPGATCPFSVAAKPKTAGAKSALVVATGASGEIARATVKVTVLRTGLAIAPPVDLGAVLVGTPAAAKKTTVRNIGQVPVVIAAVALSGPQAAEFAIVTNGCAGITLKPKATCVVAVGGSPLQPGLRSATITVTGGRKESAKTTGRMRGAVPTTTVATTIPPPTTKPATTAVPVTKPPTTVVVATSPPATLPPTTPPTSPPTVPPTATPTAPPPIFAPTLVMRPAVGHPGTVTSAVGTGFPPNTTVHLAWEGDRVVRTVATDAAGRFSLPVLILQSERIGGRYMATVDDPLDYPAVRAPFLLQLATFRPPGDSGGSGSLVGRG